MVMIKKYDIEREAQAKWFLETVSGLKCEFQDNFQASLKDGVLLATAMNAILEKAADDSTYGQSIKIKGGKPPKMPFQQMELIGQFLSKMEKLGVPSHDRFLTVDLYENKDMNQVIDSIFSLSRTVHHLGFPIIGAKLTKRNTRTFTAEQLNNAKAAVPLLAGFTSPVKSVAIGTVRQVYSPDIGTGDTTQISKLLGGMQIDKRRSMMHMTQVFGGRRFIGGSYPTSSSTNSPARPASVYSFDPNSLNAMLKASEETATAKEDKEEEKKNSGETYEQKCTSDDETTGVECNSILAIEEVEGEEEKHTQVCIVEALVQPALLLLHAEQVVSPQHSLMAIYTEAVVAAKEEEGDLPKECFTRTIDLNAIDAALDACSTGKQSSPAVEDVIVEDVQSEEDDEDDDDQNTLSNEEDHQQLPQYEAESMASNKADHEISEPVETAVTIKEE